MEDLCEVRVVTFRRPSWLRRALLSLIEQDHPDWVGIVFDDSPDREGEAVVCELSDSRIHYEPNSVNLGPSGNLNRAFKSAPYAGSNYACVLEDDNWFLPGWLSGNIAALAETGCRIIHRNQEIWDRRTDPPSPTGRTTLGRWYEPGVMSPVQLHAYSFFFPGVSNGALFWRTDCSSDLQVTDGIIDASLQEFARCLQIVEPSAYLAEPSAAWADVPVHLARRSFADRRFSRFLQHLRRATLRRDGPEVIRAAEAIAERLGLRVELERNCYNSLISLPRHALGIREAAGYAIRGAAKFALVDNVCPQYQLPPYD